MLPGLRFATCDEGAGDNMGTKWGGLAAEPFSEMRASKFGCVSTGLASKFSMFECIFGRPTPRLKHGCEVAAMYGVA